ncbi:hypothetical protein G6F24_016959 [Rhizopus arrhizus]|nr:hypothetical protein G6F24_016959 [Rhizopus arrhizus]
MAAADSRNNPVTLPRVDGTTARARTQHRVDAITADGFTGGLALGVLVHGSCSSRLTISNAASATSSPLLPWLPPARASASSARSTASTPFSTGTPKSSCTRIRPSAQRSATCS